MNTPMDDILGNAKVNSGEGKPLSDSMKSKANKAKGKYGALGLGAAAGLGAVGGYSQSSKGNEIQYAAAGAGAGLLAGAGIGQAVGYFTKPITKVG